jgi:hypothetical protein
MYNKSKDIFGVDRDVMGVSGRTPKMDGVDI